MKNEVEIIQELKKENEELKKKNTIEAITNANGTAIKFSDGTMICYALSIKCGKEEPYTEVTYPVAFIQRPSISLTNIYMNTKNILWTVGDANSNAFRAYKKTVDNAIEYDGYASYIAIGRWK